MKCLTCKHYHLNPLTHRSYSFYCRGCKRYLIKPDLYEPIEPKEVGNADEKPPSLSEWLRGIEFC